MITSCEQIIHGKWIITCEEQNQVLENHALLIDKGTIQDILPSDVVRKNYTADKVEEFPTHAIVPGFVNAHTHVPMNYFRGLADDLALMNWLQNHIWPAEKKWLDAEFVYDASLFAMAEMIRSGTTSFNDMFFFMPATAKAAEKAGLRAHIGMHIITFPTNWAKDAEDEFAKAESFYQEFKNSKNVTMTVAAHSMYTVTDDQYLLRIKDIAEKYDLQINIHVQEPRTEMETLLTRTTRRPLEHLAFLGLLNPRLIAVHMLHVNDKDFELLEQYKPNIVHCPESNMKLASGICPALDLLQRGVNVALGTDGAASNNDLDMLGEMRTAAFLAKHHTQNPESLSAEQTLKMATINGARALNVHQKRGTLAKGKDADFIAIQLEEIETLPLYHPISQIVYAASRHQVTDVWVGGKKLLDNRKLTTLDEKELIAKAKEWGEKIKT
jgi:5-methylthioadenosine/S-adenosylhomocysteine deaminase